MRSAYFAASLTLGISIGFLLGRLSVVEGDGDTATAAHSPTKASTGDGAADLTNASERERTASGQDSGCQPMSEAEVIEGVQNLQAGTLSGAESSRAWAELWDRLRVSDLPSLAASLGATSTDGEDRALATVLAVWTEVDPQQAWAFAQSMEPAPRRRNAIFWVLGTWARADHAAALAKVVEVKDEVFRQQVRSRILATLAQKDPALAFEIAIQDGGSGAPSIVGSILRQWVRKDPVAARAAASRLQGRMAQEASSSVVEELSKLDPRAAWDYVQGLPPHTEPHSFKNLQSRVIELWAQSDPSSAIAAASTIPDLAKRDDAMISAVYTWSSSDFDAALSYAVTGLEPGVQARILQRLAQSENAPHEAVFAALIEHSPTSGVFKDSVTMLMERWARTDPQAAATATSRLTPRDGLPGAVAAVADEWATSPTDRQQLLNWAATLPEGEVRDAALKEAFERWGARDPAAAQQLLSAAGAATNKQAIEGFLEGWNRASPGDAARWALLLPENLRPDDAMRDAIRSWARSSPTDAAPFLESMPASIRPEVTMAFVEMWSSRDPEAAASWVKSQPAGPAKDAGISTIVEVIADDDPETALAWTRSMANEEARLDCTEEILQSWLTDDPARAKAWIAAAQIPEALRIKLSKEQ